jgi:hypothetical protein
MIDRLALMYLIHTPKIPEELRDGAFATAKLRYTNYRRAVDKKLATEYRGAGAATAAQETAVDDR